MENKKIVSDARKLLGKLFLQVDSEIEEFLNFIKDNNVKSILEIGAYAGGTAYCFSFLVDKLVCVDRKTSRNKSAFLEAEKNCNFKMIRGDSKNYSTKDEIKKEFPDGVDLIFIDGDHTYNGAKTDFCFYFDLVKKGSFVCFHDIVDSEQHRKSNCTVYKLWEEVKKKYDCSEIVHNKKWGGIGILKVK